MKKRVQSLLVVMAMVVSMLPIKVAAEDGPSYTMRVEASETKLQQSTEDQKVIFTVTLEGAENHKVYGIQMQFVPNSDLVLAENRVYEENTSGYFFSEVLEYHERYSPDGIYTNVEYYAPTKTFACFGATDERALSKANQILMTIEGTIPANTSGEFTLGLLNSTDGSQGEARVTSEGSVSNVATVIPATVMVENPATSVELDQEATTLSIGDTTTLHATVGATYDPGPSTDQVVWKSSDKDVATVDQDGEVTAVGDGTATITVTANGFKDTCEITVNARAQDALTITSGDTVDYDDTLTLTTSGGSGSGEVSYKVINDTGKATIEGSTLTATQAGTVTVVATKAGSGEYGQVKSEPQTITINKIDYTGEKAATFNVNNNGTVSYNFTLPELPEGASYPTGIPSLSSVLPGTVMINSISDNDLFIRVWTNNLTVGNTYSTTLDVTGATNYNDYTVDVTFEIVAQPTQTIAFDAETHTVTYGDGNFTKTVTGAQTDVTYTSDDTGVATVDETTGEVTIVGAGSAVITATAESGTHAEATDSYEITVNAKSLADSMIETIDAETFTGSAITPTITVIDGEALALTTDYTVVYDNNINVGTGKVAIAGQGNYTGTAEATFTIEKADAPTSGSDSVTVRYNDTAEKSVSITGIPSDAGTKVITVQEDDDNNIIATSSIDGTGVKFTLEDSLTLQGQSATIAATVESDNYEDYTFVITVNLSDKESQDISYGVSAIDKTYGDDNFTNELTKTIVSGAISYASNNTAVATVDTATGAVTIVGAGTATITAIAAATDAYAQTAASYTLNVAKADQAALTVTGGTSVMYGNTLSFATTGGAGTGAVTYTVANGTGTATINEQTGVLTASGVGTVTVTATKAADKNYNKIAATKVITITPATITKPTADSTSFTYTGSELSYNPAGFDSNTMTINGNTAINAVTNQTVTVSLKDKVNYTWDDLTTTDVTFNFAIAKADYTGEKSVSTNVMSNGMTDTTVTLPTLPDGASYGTPSASGTIVATNLSVNGNTLTFTVPASTAGDTGAISVAVTGATNYKDYNVNVNLTSADKTADTTTMTITLSDITFGDSWTDPAVEGKPSDAGAVTYSYEGRNSTTYGPSASAPENVGEYTVSATAENDTHIYTAASDYKITTKSISGAEITLGTALVYTGGIQTQTVTSVTLDGENVTYDLSSNTGTNAGEYTLAITGNGNYTGEVTKNFTINPKAVTATIDAITAVTFDGEAQKPSVTAKDGTTTIASSEYTVQYTNNTNVGTANVTLKDVTGGNYTVSGSANFIINKATHTDGVASSYVKYDVTADQSVDISSKIPANAGTVSGIAVAIDTDTNGILSATGSDISKKTVYYTPAGAASYASQTATFIATVTTQNYENFDVVITVNLIDKLAQTISFAEGAVTKNYIDEDFTVKAKHTAGDGDVTYTSDTTSVADVNAITGKITIKGAGTATITATAAETADYAEAVATYTLTVNKGTITITADDKSAYNGETEPSYTYKVTGLRAGEALTTVPTVDCATVDMAADGTYPITASGAVAPAGDNYNAISYVDGTLTVSAKPSVGSYITYYDIEIDVAGKGVVKPDGGSDDIERVAKYTTKIFTFTPDKGYEIADVLVNGKSVGAVDSYKFEKVTNDQTLKVVFEEINVAGWKNPFIDVDSNDWFYNGVKYVHMNGLMDGTSANTFAPLDNTTRSMVWTVLARMESVDLEGGVTWYSKAQEWAMDEGVSDGSYPDTLITREQFVTMLWRNEGRPVIADYEGLEKFADIDELADYAQLAMVWAHAEGIIAGKSDDVLDPKGNMTRAEMAVILQRYLTTD